MFVIAVYIYHRNTPALQTSHHSTINKEPPINERNHKLFQIFTKIVQTMSILIQTIPSFLFINDDQMYRFQVFHSDSFSLFGRPNIHKKRVPWKSFPMFLPFYHIPLFSAARFLFMLLARPKHRILIYFPNSQNWKFYGKSFFFSFCCIIL